MAKKVLIIEDSPTQALKAKFLLEELGYEATFTLDGKDGVTKAQQLQPNLIVLDINLPNWSGFEVCKILKKDLQLRTIPVIMFSSENKLENMVNAYEIGADYYVVKGDNGERILSLLIETVFTRLARRSLSPC